MHDGTVSGIHNAILLHAGANVQKGKSLDSPLHAAAEKDCTAVVKLLLDFGADINARNTEFQRPVDVAPPSSLTEGFLLLYEGTVLLTCLQSHGYCFTCNYFFLLVATPRLLSQLCRHCIRNCVGRDRLHLLSHLPLPNRLRIYLQYQWPEAAKTTFRHKHWTKRKHRHHLISMQ